MATYGEGHSALDRPFLILAVQGGVVRDLVQPSDTVEEIRIVPEVSDVYRDLSGRSMEFVHPRPLNHVPQLSRAKIPPRWLNNTSGMNQ